MLQFRTYPEPMIDPEKKRFRTRAYAAPMGLEDEFTGVSTHTRLLTERERALRVKVNNDGPSPDIPFFLTHSSLVIQVREGTREMARILRRMRLKGY